MNFKKLAAIVLSSVMAVTLFACGGGATTAAATTAAAAGETTAAAAAGATTAAAGATDAAGIVIGMTLNNTGADPYQTAYYDAAVQHAADLGVELKILDPAGDVTKQQNQVQDLIGMKPDVIVLWPTNSEAGVSLAKQIHAAGIPVMTANTNISPEGKEFLVAYVGPSNVEEGRQTAEQMVKDLGNDAKIVYIDGQMGYSTSDERRQGMDEGIAGTNIQVLETQTGEGNREKSQQVMENYLVKYPEGSIDGVFCMDDNIAIGAINAMEAAGRTDLKIYAAACGDYNTLDYIRAGTLSATAMQSPITDAKTAIDYAVKIAKGETLAQFDNFMETPVATPENVDTLNIEKW